MDEINAERIAEFASELQQREKRRTEGKRLELATINSCLRALRRVVRLAVEWEVIEVAPKVKMMAGERHRERVLTTEEENLYLAASPSLLHDVSLVLLDTGMRPEECHRMRWEHINWAGGRYGIVLIEKGKTKAARRPLPLSLTGYARCWRSAGKIPEARTRVGLWPADTKDEHINHDTLKGQHKNALQLSKVRPFEVYSIRHTFLTRLGESGCDVWTLARIAGHSSIKMSQRYVHPSDDAVLNAFSRLGGHKIGHTPKWISRRWPHGF